MTVYIDILLLVNFIINLSLLKCSAFLGKRSLPLLKGVLASFIGSLSSLSLFLPPFSFAAMMFYKLLFASVMVFLSFGYENISIFFRELFLLLFCTFIFAGLINFIFISLRPSKLILFNGSFYFDVSALFLVSAAVFSFLFVTGMTYFFGNPAPKEDICKIKLCLEKEDITFKGLIDTGNSLHEPFSNLPVMVINKGLLNEAYFLNKSFRIVPFESIGKDGFMKAFLGEDLTFFLKGEAYHVKKGCYIALSEEKVGHGLYDAVINPEILENKRRERNDTTP